MDKNSWTYGEYMHYTLYCICPRNLDPFNILSEVLKVTVYKIGRYFLNKQYTVCPKSLVHCLVAYPTKMARKSAWTQSIPKTAQLNTSKKYFLHNKKGKF